MTHSTVSPASVSLSLSGRTAVHSTAFFFASPQARHEVLQLDHARLRGVGLCANVRGVA